MHSAAGGTSHRLKPAFATVCSRSNIPNSAPGMVLPALSTVAIRPSLQPPAPGVSAVYDPIRQKVSHGPVIAAHANTGRARIDGASKPITLCPGPYAHPVHHRTLQAVVRGQRKRLNLQLHRPVSPPR